MFILRTSMLIIHLHQKLLLFMSFGMTTYFYNPYHQDDRVILSDKVNAPDAFTRFLTSLIIEQEPVSSPSYF